MIGEQRGPRDALLRLRTAVEAGDNLRSAQRQQPAGGGGGTGHSSLGGTAHKGH